VATNVIREVMSPLDRLTPLVPKKKHEPPAYRVHVACPALEVADVFRDHGAAWRHANRGHVSLLQLKVMSAIESCRTAALGGHVARCEDCAHTTIAYNSCLMGKSINGELACRHRHFSVNCSDLCLHNSAVLRLHRLGH
jgi:transposase-like zinc-binding protein